MPRLPRGIVPRPWANPVPGGDARGRPNGTKTGSARAGGRYTKSENALSALHSLPCSLADPQSLGERICAEAISGLMANSRRTGKFRLDSVAVDALGLSLRRAS